MSQTMTAYLVGIMVAMFVAIYLALRYWARQRHQMANLGAADIAGGAKTQQRSLSAGVQHPSMDVD